MGGVLTWPEFARARPDLADAGRALLYQYGVGLAFLATVDRHGGPRTHPVCPLVADDGLFLFVIPSPKRNDLHRDGRFALHAFPPEANEDAFSIYGGTQERLNWLLRDSSALFRLPGNYLPLSGERGDVGSAPPMDLMGPLTGRPENAIVSGDVRANENIGLTALTTLFGFARACRRSAQEHAKRLAQRDVADVGQRRDDQALLDA